MLDTIELVALIKIINKYNDFDTWAQKCVYKLVTVRSTTAYIRSETKIHYNCSWVTQGVERGVATQQKEHMSTDVKVWTGWGAYTVCKYGI